MLAYKLRYLYRMALAKCSYRARIGLLECGYRFRLGVLKCGNLPGKLEVLRGGFEGLVLRGKIRRLNRLEKRLNLSNERCRLAILAKLNQFSEESVDGGNGFESGHIL